MNEEGMMLSLEELGLPVMIPKDNMFAKTV